MNQPFRQDQRGVAGSTTPDDSATRHVTGFASLTPCHRPLQRRLTFPLSVDGREVGGEVKFFIRVGARFAYGFFPAIDKRGTYPTPEDKGRPIREVALKNRISKRPFSVRS